MVITVLEKFGHYPGSVKSQLFLLQDNWNDYNFFTVHSIYYVDNKHQRHDFGRVRIGYFGQVEEERLPKAGDKFDNGLPNNFFSLGRADYYESLNKLTNKIRDEILSSLHDIARFPQTYHRAINEKVTRISLMRGITETEVTGQLRRMANGGRKLLSYDFEFESPVLRGINSKYKLSFKVKPESTPPTNIHVLIGRNASGKTSLFNSMVSSLIRNSGDNTEIGNFISDQIFLNKQIFPNLILVSYSAFDEAGLQKNDASQSSPITYTYIGLKKYIDPKSFTVGLKSFTELKEEFIESLLVCKDDLKADKWKSAMEILESDPNFKEEGFIALFDIEERDEFIQRADDRFSKLSSGHKIILLTITRLVATLEEKSLVLIDEPETHLHPPLLSSFTRVISSLLIDRNGVAIIATHSPVILQEVPRACVWKLRRNGAEAIAERLEIESFGENVGVLTQEVFGLEVTDSGFHKILKELVRTTASYEMAIELLNNQIGLEAKAILRSLFYHKANPNENNT